MERTEKNTLRSVGNKLHFCFVMIKMFMWVVHFSPWLSFFYFLFFLKSISKLSHLIFYYCFSCTLGRRGGGWGWGAGAFPSCLWAKAGLTPWTSRQFIAGSHGDRQSFASLASVWTAVGSRSTRRGSTHREGQHANSMQKVPGPGNRTLDFVVAKRRC